MDDVLRLEPIVDSRGNLVSYEALVGLRSRIFHQEMERASRSKDWMSIRLIETGILEKIHRVQLPNTEIWFNVSWVSLASKVVTEYILYRFRNRPQGLELTEECWGYGKKMERIIANLQLLRNHGIRLILDDFGEKNNNLDVFHLGWDVVKVSGHWLHWHLQEGLWTELKHLSQLIRTTGAVPVAEFIEKPIQWFILKDLGFEWFQGYWITENLHPKLYVLTKHLHTRGKHEESKSRRK